MRTNTSISMTLLQKILVTLRQGEISQQRRALLTVVIEGLDTLIIAQNARHHEGKDQ